MKKSFFTQFALPKNGARWGKLRRFVIVGCVMLMTTYPFSVRADEWDVSQATLDRINNLGWSGTYNIDCTKRDDDILLLPTALPISPLQPGIQISLHVEVDANGNPIGIFSTRRWANSIETREWSTIALRRNDTFVVWRQTVRIYNKRSPSLVPGMPRMKKDDTFAFDTVRDGLVVENGQVTTRAGLVY